MTIYVAPSYVENYYTDTGEAASGVTGQVAAVGPLGAALVLGSTVVVGVAQAGSPLGPAAIRGAVSISGRTAAASPLGEPAVFGRAVIRAEISAGSPLGGAAARAAVVPLGRMAAGSPLGGSGLLGTVVRYELRGEVRAQGVLVNRRVRAYNRASGALVVEADTVAGLFVLPAGVAADEYYLVPINLDPAATDYAPPCANRVTSVLAMDAAA